MIELVLMAALTVPFEDSEPSSAPYASERYEASSGVDPWWQPNALEHALQQVADEIGREGIGISLSLYSDEVQVSAVGGCTDTLPGSGHCGRPTERDDRFVWGSITKMFTAAAVFQLVERGVVGLEDPIALHVDPLLARINDMRLLRLEDRFAEGGYRLRGLLEALAMSPAFRTLRPAAEPVKLQHEPPPTAPARITEAQLALRDTGATR